MRKGTLLGMTTLLTAAAIMAMPSAALATSTTTGSASASAAIGAGSLSIGEPSAVTFPPVTLTGTAQLAAATPACGASPNGCIAITDATGSGNGWNLTVSATQFTQAAGQPNPGKTLSTDALSLQTAPVPASIDASSTPPTVSVTTPAIVSAAGIKVVNAQAGSGMGSFNVPIAYQLAVRADAYQGTYSSTLTFTLASTP